jgi:hypothetical protein
MQCNLFDVFLKVTHLQRNLSLGFLVVTFAPPFLEVAAIAAAAHRRRVGETGVRRGLHAREGM